MTDVRRKEQLRIQAVGAAISRRDWHAVEQAYNAIRDEFDRRATPSSPVSAPSPAGVREALDREWLKTEISAIDLWYRGDPSYMRDAYWMKDRVLKLLDHPGGLSSPATAEPVAAPAGEVVVEAAREYFAALESQPEKDCWDTESGEEEPGAEKFASDWSWQDHHAKIIDARNKLRAALSNPAPGHGEGVPVAWRWREKGHSDWKMAARLPVKHNGDWEIEALGVIAHPTGEKESRS